MKKLLITLIKFTFFISFSTHALSNEQKTISLDDAKKYAQDLPKLMMSGKKGKTLIDTALARIEEECCSEKFTDEAKINKIKKSLEKCLENGCHNKTYIMWAIKRPRKLIVLNQIDELETLLLNNEKINILDTKSREDELLEEKNKAKGDYEKLLITYNKLEKDNKELKVKIEKLLKNYENQISKLEKESKELSDKNNELLSLLPPYQKRKLKKKSSFLN
tara:strand:+ start:2852 stop:3511 length:660 start_codon:yes stop_codon:yes gene_type:complete